MGRNVLDSETFLNQAPTFLSIVSTLYEVLSLPMNVLFVRSEVNVESETNDTPKVPRSAFRKGL